MTTAILIVGILLLVASIGIGVFLVFLYRNIQILREEQGKDPLSQMMNQNLQAMHERLDKAAHYIGTLGQELRSMQDIGKNINDLRSAFFSPKLRGNFGEQVLYDALDNAFPADHFEKQYRFQGGQVVDAILKTNDGLIPIDSKFPIDNFRNMVKAETDQKRAFEKNEFKKAVKKHIGDIAKKYILPGEGTTKFAVMYVPSEAVFYEIISGDDKLTEQAQLQNVLMVSPNSLSYFLHILRMGLEKVRIEENVQLVWELLTGLQQETGKFGDSLSVLGTHLKNAGNQMDKVSGEYGKLTTKFEKIRELK